MQVFRDRSSGVKHLLGEAGAAAALLGHPQFPCHFPERSAAVHGTGANLAIGDWIAKADDHDLSEGNVE